MALAAELMFDHLETKYLIQLLQLMNFSPNLNEQKGHCITSLKLNL